jgi:uncharacterized membrane protein YwaF
MTWGTFGIVHIISLLLGILLNVALYFILKRRSARVQLIVLGVLSFSGIAAILFNLLTWGSPLEYLPFHLCSLSALVLPFAVLLRSQRLGNLLLLWSLGALFALIVNHAAADFEILSWTFVFYFFPHVLEFGIPILLFKLKMIKLSPKCIASTLAITLASYTVIHLINVWVNRYCVENQVVDYAGEIIQVNYMFSITPENPLLALFYSVIPHPFWYMLLAIPVAAVYLGVIYSMHWWLSRRKQKEPAPLTNN